MDRKRASSSPLPGASYTQNRPKQVRFATVNVPNDTGNEMCASESETCVSETEGSDDDDDDNLGISSGSECDLEGLSETEDIVALVKHTAHDPIPIYEPHQDIDESSGDEVPYVFQKRNELGPLDMSKDPGMQIRKQILHVKNTTNCSDTACDGFMKIICNITEHTNLQGCISKCYKSLRSTALADLPNVTMRFIILDKQKQEIKELRNQSSFPTSLYGDKRKFKVLTKFYELSLAALWKFHTEICEDHSNGYLS